MNNPNVHPLLDVSWYLATCMHDCQSDTKTPGMSACRASLAFPVICTPLARGQDFAITPLRRCAYVVHLLVTHTDTKELTRNGFATGSSSIFTRPFDGTMTRGIGVVAACMTALAPSEAGACRLRMNQRTGEGRRELAYMLELTAPGSTAQNCTSTWL